MSNGVDLSISVVTYKSALAVLNKLFDSILSSDLRLKIFVIDNSPDRKIEKICEKNGFVYIPNSKNIGYGTGHNTAIKKIPQLSKYHLVINPDIYFEKGTLEKIFRFMEDNPAVGLAMPKVLYPDGSCQFLCRLLPSPLDLFLRRLYIPILSNRKNYRYELRFSSYNRVMDVPYLSGCFMFIRSTVFEKVGIFDERLFMYLEDVDLSRRIHRYYRIAYYPEVVVYHGYRKESYRNPMILKYHIHSAVKYFNKWGWFFDSERAAVNKETIEKIKSDSL